jgi:two-component system chemotaxis response regulator CheB
MVNGGDIPPEATPQDDRAADPLQGEQVITVCPECGGVLSERAVGAVTQWECRVGHRYSPDTLADAQAQGVEAALWAAVRALEDRELLLNRMADQAVARSQRRSARSFRQRAEAAGRNAQQVRAALRQAAASSLRTVDDDETSDEESAA